MVADDQQDNPKKDNIFMIFFSSFICNDKVGRLYIQVTTASASWIYTVAGYLSCVDNTSAVLDVLDRHSGGSVGDTQLVRAAGLVAHSKVKGAVLVIAKVAHGIEDVDELVVLSSKGVGLLKAVGNIVDAVGGAKRQLAVVQQVGALADVDKLPVHVEAAALLGVGGGGLAKDERVPGIVGDVMGAAGGVDLEDVEGAALVGELNADVVAVDVAGPVGDAVGVDVAAEDADGGRVLLVGGDGDGAASGEDDGRDGGGGGGEEAESRAEGRHLVFFFFGFKKKRE